jgi:hypothetical protein
MVLAVQPSRSPILKRRTYAARRDERPRLRGDDTDLSDQEMSSARVWTALLTSWRRTLLVVPPVCSPYTRRNHAQHTIPSGASARPALYPLSGRGA